MVRRPLNLQSQAVPRSPLLRNFDLATTGQERTRETPFRFLEVGDRADAQRQAGNGGEALGREAGFGYGLDENRDIAAAGQPEAVRLVGGDAVADDFGRRAADAMIAHACDQVVLDTPA